MEYLKTFEQLKNFYQKELGLRDLIIVSTIDEKWLIWGYTFGNLKYQIERKRINLEKLSDVEKYNKLSDYGVWKSKKDAQYFIDIINKGGYKGLSLGYDEDDMGYSEEEEKNAPIIYEDLKDKLKIITYTVGGIKDPDILL